MEAAWVAMVVKAVMLAARVVRGSTGRGAYDEQLPWPFGEK